ncbi:MAG: hydroxymethylglutaryl-CoA lyase [Oceanospirillaceae bacterium]|nr:hydroxymethylglutaryl-CoA lyase [Oceanospirillaceae bacterium]
MSSSTVRIVDVSPRDGLQNEPTRISTEAKLGLIERLSTAGLQHIEVGSFVSPHRVPCMADSMQVCQSLPKHTDINFYALVPNVQGLQKAIDAGLTEVAVFTAASEQFCQRNINCSIDESLSRFSELMVIAEDHDIRVRGYISTVFGCPYQGTVSIEKVVNISQQLLEMGCYEISLGDTIGIGTANQVKILLNALCQTMPIEKVAVHFHDSYGQALTNIYAALEAGVRVIDSSVAGLGGCPYAKGSTGNIATEDVVYLLNGLGLESGIDLHKIVAVGHWISSLLQRENASKVGLAMNMRR